ncbi:hypothetical protein ACKRZS_001908 [Fusarium odoratissimum]
MYLNNGVGEFNEGFSIDPKMSCSNAHIRWGDVNGDGLDDFICIQTNGELYVSINKGGSPPTFQNVGLYKRQEMGLGRDRVRLGDMDGDGRLDYCVISNAGNIHCWRNGGIGDKAAYWQDMCQGSHIFASQNTGDMRGVQLVDMNGDGRYDWTWMSKEGQVKTFINQRGDGKGMKPFWREAGITHPGRGFNIGEDREFIKWGRIFSGRPSYVNWQREGKLCNGGVTCRITYQVWENQRGRYFTERRWHLLGRHLADWDGDGKDDIIGVTDLKTGALKVWYSRYRDGKHNWDAQVIPNPPGKEWCPQGFGRLPFDNAHHFADLTGSGRTDYICMAPSGQAWAWLRDEDGVAKPSGQIKYTEDLDRANFQFADINGDGKADLIHKDKFSGDTQVWYFNRKVSEAERTGNSGSIIKWDRPEKLFRGSVQGPDTHYPRLNNQGRADMVYAKATNAQAHISFNVCPAGGDDDERDADLPTYTPPDLSPDPEGDWFCGKGNGAKWTTSLWREHGVGTWLRQRTDLYSAAENSWPNDDAKGVPRIIAEYDVFKRDHTFNWHTSCRAISDSCDFVNPLEEADDCSKHQERAFALWAMGNFALFQQKWYKAVKDGVDAASKSSGDIADKFLPVSAEDALANPAAWLTIVAGMFTTIGEITPGVLGSGVNFAAGVLTIGAGAASFGADSTEPSPQFKSFANLNKALGDMVEWTRRAMAEQFNRYFVDTPPNNNRERGSELARAIESGIWANQDIAQADSDTIWDSGRVQSMIQAAMISEMWNTGEVAIFKWSRDHELAKWGFNPCFDGNKHGLDKHVGCLNDQNYLIDEQGDARNWPDVGSDEDSLGEYNLDHATVINAAERTQNRADRFTPRGIDNLGELFTEASTQPEGDRSKYLTYFNVPVCNLNDVDNFEKYQDHLSGEVQFCTSGRTAGNLVPFCVAHMLAINCRKLSLPGGQWPYQNDIKP